MPKTHEGPLRADGKRFAVIASRFNEFIVDKLLSVSRAQAAPGNEQAVSEAVLAAADGAAKGDARLARAIDLLKSGDIGKAEALFRAVADEKKQTVRDFLKKHLLEVPPEG